MTPRCKTSTKWTKFPQEFLDQIHEVIVENFKSQTAHKTIVVDGRIYSEELLLRVGIVPTNGLRQANFEVSTEFNPNKENALKLMYSCLDAAGAMLEQHFGGLDLQEFPWDWQAHNFNNKTMYVRVSTVNTQLERQADQLLGINSDDGLVGGEDLESEKQAVHVMLGTNDDDANED